MNAERFGEKINLPPQYELFWQEYQSIAESSEQELRKEDKDYFIRRVQFFLPEVQYLVKAGREALVVSQHVRSLPVIQDVYTYFWRDDEDRMREAEHETIISVRADIETILYADEIRRYRKISSERKPIQYYTWLNSDAEGNPNKVGVLLDIFGENLEQHILHLHQEDQYQIDGNKMKSIPSAHPIEDELSAFYERIGRRKFDAVAKKYFEMKYTLRQARKIDPNSVTELEKVINKQYRELRLEVILQHSEA